MLTADWQDTDVYAYLDFCDDVEIADPTVPVQVWANESDNRAGAHNPNGDASGIFQLMPQTAKSLGYDIAADPHLDAYRASGLVAQFAMAARYYGAHKGKVGTVARFYCSTFMPAFLGCADDPAYVLAADGGIRAWAYGPNRGLDVTGRGSITIGDLVSAAARATGPRTRELMARVTAAKAARATTEPAPPES